jgi:hypothetical protein
MLKVVGSKTCEFHEHVATAFTQGRPAFRHLETCIFLSLWALQIMKPGLGGSSDVLEGLLCKQQTSVGVGLESRLWDPELWDLAFTTPVVLSKPKLSSSSCSLPFFYYCCLRQ